MGMYIAPSVEILQFHCHSSDVLLFGEGNGKNIWCIFDNAVRSDLARSAILLGLHQWRFFSDPHLVCNDGTNGRRHWLAPPQTGLFISSLYAVVLAAVGVLPVYFLGRVIALHWEDVAATIHKILQ